MSVRWAKKDGPHHRSEMFLNNLLHPLHLDKFNLLLRRLAGYCGREGKANV
jgi:hypothetical protein